MPPSSLGPEPTPAAPVWRRALLYALFAGFALWCVLAFQRDLAQISLAPFKEGWWAVAAAAGLSLLNYALRVLRWQWYMRRAGHHLPWGFTALAFMSGFAFTLSPGKVGEMVRARYYLPKGVPLSATTGAFFVERLLDLLVMILLAAVAFAELQAYSHFLWVAIGLVVVLLLSVAVMPWQRWAEALKATRPRGWRAAMLTGVDMFAQSRQFLSPGLLLAGLAVGLVAWGVEAWGLYLVAQVVVPEQLTLAGATGIYAIAIIVGALSFLPGGLGSTEAVMTALLYTHGVPMPQAILLTLVCRLLTLWLAVGIGWLCVWALRGRATDRP